jgi:carboxyl-terminal processing protease
MKKLQVALPVLFAVVMILGMAIGYRLRENIPGNRGLFDAARKSSLQEVLDLVRTKYVDKVNTDSLVEDGVNGLLSDLDPHSVYIPASDLSMVNEDLQGNFQGIGVEFQIIKDTVHVVNVLAGGPSERAGLQVGDQFIKVDDSVVAGNINSDRIRKLLRGPEGSQVNVVLLRNKQTVNKTITRGTIPLYSVDAAYMMDGTTGYIHLNKFSSTTYEEFMSAMEKLQKQGMKQLIFDLRDNGGGILQEAVDIVDEFIDQDKLIVYTEGQSQPKVEFKTKRPGLFEKGKLVLLVDENSASASEVVAGALQDWDRATIVGRRTFGKGLVQEQYDLSDGSALRLTIARYYTPTGRSIQKPYAEGRSKYEEELANRYHNGELISADSVHIDTSKAFKTKGGRKVYGGGGITPDVFVPYDTTGFSADITPLFIDQDFGKFIYTYYKNHKAELDKFRTAKDFAAGFRSEDAAYAELQQYMKANNIQLSGLGAQDVAELKKRIKTWLARQIFRMEGYYVVANEYDKTVLRGREELAR